MQQPATPCPSCGSPATGAFCSHCGAAVGPRRCVACGTALAPTARFCAGCGAPAGAGAGAAAAPAVAAGSRPVVWAYLLVGVAVVAVVLALVWSGATPPPTPVAGGAAPGDPTAIDLTTMTPRDRFDRLYNRVMRAAENGDEATLTQFSPMALAAYAQLEAIDADARYHAAMIRMHTGDPEGAAALADTIRAATPNHLFSYVIHATLARQRGDQAQLRMEHAGFLEHYEAELASQRPEYGHHQFILDQVRDQARAGMP